MHVYQSSDGHQEWHANAHANGYAQDVISVAKRRVWRVWRLDTCRELLCGDASCRQCTTKALVGSLLQHNGVFSRLRQHLDNKSYWASGSLGRLLSQGCRHISLSVSVNMQAEIWKSDCLIQSLPVVGTGMPSAYCRLCRVDMLTASRRCWALPGHRNHGLGYQTLF